MAKTEDKKFLDELVALGIWDALIDLTGHQQSKSSKKVCRSLYPLRTMLLILLLLWYSLSYPAMYESLIEVPSIRSFTGVNAISDRILNESTILTFLHRLEKDKLGEQIFETIKAYLNSL